MAIGAGLASRLDRRIDILRAQEVDDGMSTTSGGFVIVGSRSASKVDISDGERVRAAAQDQSLTTRFLVRADALTKTITGKDQIQCEGRTYAVVGTKEWGGRGVGIEITANDFLEVNYS